MVWGCLLGNWVIRDGLELVAKRGVCCGFWGLLILIVIVFSYILKILLDRLRILNRLADVQGIVVLKKRFC